MCVRFFVYLCRFSLLDQREEPPTKAAEAPLAAVATAAAATASAAAAAARDSWNAAWNAADSTDDPDDPSPARQREIEGGQAGRGPGKRSADSTRNVKR